MSETSKEPMVFSATLTREPNSSATFITIPFNVMNYWGSRARVPVKGTINGTPFRGSIVPYGGVHYLGIKRDLRDAVGVKAGDMVEIVLDYDAEPRIIEPPADLLTALEAQPAVKIRWNKLSYSHQREHTEAIEEAVKPETRIKRIEQTIDRLLGKQKK